MKKYFIHTPKGFEMKLSAKNFPMQFAKLMTAQTTQAPMTKELATIFLQLVMMESENEIPQELRDDFGFQVFKKRVPFFDKTITVSDAVCYLMSFLAEGSPGIAVMYACSMLEVARSQNVKHITITQIANVYREGFPSKERLSKIWDMQKGFNCEPRVDCDNVLDRPSAWV